MRVSRTKRWSLVALFLGVLGLVGNMVFHQRTSRRVPTKCHNYCQSHDQVGTNPTERAALATEDSKPGSPQTAGDVVVMEASKAQVVLFSTWVSRPHKRVIHSNVLRTWPMLSPSTFLCLLFSQQEDERRKARSYGWLTPSFPKTTCGGVPILREMFYIAMDSLPSGRLFGFINGDLLLGSTLEETLHNVLENSTLMSGPLLMLLCRSNVPFTVGFHVKDLQDVENLKANGTLVIDGSSDAFITNRLFPWHLVPDIVVGRMGMGMWLVAAARALNVTVIDLTDTVTTLHMTSSRGILESYWHRNASCNRDMFLAHDLEPSSWRCGYVQCADLYSTKYGVRRVRFQSPAKANKTVPIGCQKCRFNTSKLMKIKIHTLT